MQLTELLYLVAKHSDGEKSYEQVAEAVSAEYDKGVSADNVRTLVDDKLRPLGLMVLADGTQPQLAKTDPLLALKFRKQIIPPTAARAASYPFKPLFWPPVVLAALVGLVALDVWLFGSHGVAQATRQAINDPALMLLLFAMIVLAAGWHEFGHAAGCAYGGGEPGGMGAGLYLAYPAFYTDVTDAYRLNKRGRLRTDLAGVYFNVVFILATAGVYFLTHWEPLLLVIVLEHFEMVHQLLPLLRLDGYYIVADMTGVPDLFNRIGPILSSAVPGRKADERVRQLKMWVRVVVTAWVLIVVPLLLFQLVMLLVHLPRILATMGDSLMHQWHAAGKAFGHGQLVNGIAAAAQSLILVLPMAGIVLTFARLGRRVFRWGWTGHADAPAKRAAFAAVSLVVLAGLIYVWLPDGDYKPIQPGERGTLSEGVRAISHVANGHSSLESRNEAAQRGDLGAAAGDTNAAASTTTTSSTTSTTIGRHTTTTARTTRTTRRTPTTVDTSPTSVGDTSPTTSP